MLFLNWPGVVTGLFHFGGVSVFELQALAGSILLGAFRRGLALVRGRIFCFGHLVLCINHDVNSS
jgi:hypothetical protein